MIVYHLVLDQPIVDETMRDIGASHARALVALADKKVAFGQTCERMGVETFTATDEGLRSRRKFRLARAHAVAPRAKSGGGARIACANAAVMTRCRR